MAKVVSIKEAVDLVKPGDRLMTSGFLGCSAPLKLIEGLVEKGTGDLTLIQPVMSFPYEEHDVSKLAINGQVKKIIASHVGTSKAIPKMYFKNEIEVDFIPMGTVAECIHAAGAGLGAVLTPVGVGTTQEENHEKIERNGREYLIYDPLPGDVAFIKLTKADKAGNCYAFGTSKGMTLEMALACKTVVAEVDEIVDIGEIAPSDVFVPGMLVDYIVQGQTPEERHEYYNALWGRHHLLSEGGI